MADEAEVPAILVSLASSLAEEEAPSFSVQSLAEEFCSQAQAPSPQSAAEGRKAAEVPLVLALPFVQESGPPRPAGHRGPSALAVVVAAEAAWVVLD